MTRAAAAIEIDAPAERVWQVVADLDAYADWQVNGNFIISFVAAVANPQEAVEEAVGRTENFTYGMIYVTYSY